MKKEQRAGLGSLSLRGEDGPGARRGDSHIIVEMGTRFQRGNKLISKPQKATLATESIPTPHIGEIQLLRDC